METTQNQNDSSVNQVIDTKKYYSQLEVSLLFFFFGPIAGLYALYKNNRSLLQLRESRILLLIGILYMIPLVYLIGFMMTRTVILFILIIHPVFGYLYYQGYQKKNIAYAITKGSSYHSGRRTFGVGIVGMIVFILLYYIKLIIAVQLIH